MDWRDEMNERLGLDKNQKAKINDERVKELKQQLSEEFAIAFRALEEALRKLVRAGKTPNLQSQGGKHTLTVDGKSVEINLYSDQSRIDINANGTKVDSIVIFVNGDSIILDSTKKPVDTNSFIGQILMRVISAT